MFILKRGSLGDTNLGVLFSKKDIEELADLSCLMYQFMFMFKDEILTNFLYPKKTIGHLISWKKKVKIPKEFHEEVVEDSLIDACIGLNVKCELSPVLTKDFHNSTLEKIASHFNKMGSSTDCPIFQNIKETTKKYVLEVRRRSVLGLVVVNDSILLRINYCRVFDRMGRSKIEFLPLNFTDSEKQSIDPRHGEWLFEVPTETKYDNERGGSF